MYKIKHSFPIISKLNISINSLTFLYNSIFMLTILLLIKRCSTSNHLYIFYIRYIFIDKVLVISELSVKDTNFNNLQAKTPTRYESAF